MIKITDIFTSSVRENLARLREGEDRAHKGDLEGVHLVRTSCRRLRSTVKYLGDSLPKNERKSLQDGLRSLMGALSPVRDLDVLRHAVEGVPAIAAPDAGRLHAAIDLKLAKAVAKMNESLAGEAHGALLAGLEKSLSTPASSDPAEMAGPGRISSALTSVLRDRPVEWAAVPEERLHELRKSVKKYRYALEAFQPIYGRPVNRAIDRCRDLQESLGIIQDAAAFGVLLRGMRTFAAGQFIATVRTRADQEIQKLPTLWDRAFDAKNMSRLGGHLYRRIVKSPTPEAPAAEVRKAV